MDLLEAILAIVRGKLPPTLEARIDSAANITSIEIYVKAHSLHLIVGWFNLSGSTLTSVGSTKLLQLDLSDPSNTQKKIENFIETGIREMKENLPKKWLELWN